MSDPYVQLDGREYRVDDSASSEVDGSAVALWGDHGERGTCPDCGGTVFQWTQLTPGASDVVACCDTVLTVTTR